MLYSSQNNLDVMNSVNYGQNFVEYLTYLKNHISKENIHLHRVTYTTYIVFIIILVFIMMIVLQGFFFIILVGLFYWIQKSKQMEKRGIISDFFTALHAYIHIKPERFQEAYIWLQWYHQILYPLIFIQQFLNPQLLIKPSAYIDCTLSKNHNSIIQPQAIPQKTQDYWGFYWNFWTQKNMSEKNFTTYEENKHLSIQEQVEKFFQEQKMGAKSKKQ